MLVQQDPVLLHFLYGHKDNLSYFKSSISSFLMARLIFKFSYIKC
jgi:hypothetical protein